MEIKKHLTPFNYTAGKNKKNQYIVIHYVGSESPAKNNAVHFASKKLKSSAHYFVDSNEIWQSVEDKDIAWHCGSETGIYKHPECRNSNSIGIEMCCFRDSLGRWFFANGTVVNTVELVKLLMQEYHIPIENIVRHYDVTGKKCPAPYVDESKWKEFKKMLEKKVINEYTEPNDIVWELGNRGIVTDTKGMLEEINKNPNGRLYWLARKFCQYARERD